MFMFPPENNERCFHINLLKCFKITANPSSQKDNKRPSRKKKQFVNDTINWCGATHLNPCFGKSKSLTQFFSHEGVWIMGFFEEPFQLVQLLQGEVCAWSSLFVVAATHHHRRRRWLENHQISIVRVRLCIVIFGFDLDAIRWITFV